MHGQMSRQHVSRGVLIFFPFFSIPFFIFSLFHFLFCLLSTNSSVFGYLIVSKIPEQVIMPQRTSLSVHILINYLLRQLYL